MGTNNLGRDKLDWTQNMWNAIDRAVHDEAKQTKIAAQFSPHYPVDTDRMTVSSETINSQTISLLTTF